MYEYIKGTVAELAPTYAVVEAAGVGYFMNISLQTYSEMEGRAEGKFYVHTQTLMDGSQILYGFAARQERDIFRLLIGVSGVGGNTARMILSTYAPRELSNIIATENAILLKNVKGLGLKTSQKIIVELKDKVAGAAFAHAGAMSAGGASDGVYDESLAALTMLGFPKNASEKVLRNIVKENPDCSVEEIIRLSLKKL